VTNQPLTSSDHAEVFTFILLMIPLAMTAVGALPILFIVFGLVLLRKLTETWLIKRLPGGLPSVAGRAGDTRCGN
jgi:hypothetical protein